MNRVRRIQAAYEAALRIADPMERARVVGLMCNQAPDEIAEVQAMLAANIPANFLQPTAAPMPERLGEFELLSLIGHGGMGVVWRARQPSLDREVAIKVLTAGPGFSPAALERFHREPRAVARLRHPHIVPVFADGIDAPHHWFSMQLIDGHSLARELQLHANRRPSDPEPLLPRFGAGEWIEAVARICADAADALQCAHENGIVHRDVKPHNLLLDQQGNVLVADFGIAHDERLGTLTDSGVIPGSLHYMSPEQAKVLDTPIDHRTDVYSLGVVLYEALTLARPFEGRTSLEIVEQIREHHTKPVRRLNPRVPRDLETICMAAMARSPEGRYATAKDLRDDLRRFLDHQSIERRPPTLLARAGQFVRRHRRVLGTAAIAVVGVGIGALAYASRVDAGATNALAARCEPLFAANLDQIDHEELAAIRRELAARPDGFAEVRALLSNYRQQLDQEPPVPDESTHLSDAELNEQAITRRQRVLRRVLIFGDDRLPRHLDALLRTGMSARIDMEVVDEHSAPTNAVISVRQIDWRTGMPGEEHRLGAAPLAMMTLPPGMYRVIVRSPSLGRFEFTRTWRPTERRRVRFMVRNRPPDPRPMAKIKGATLRISGDLERPHGLIGRPTVVDEFWLDTFEVTIGEYAAFLAATRRAAPPLWAQLAVPGLMDRPVVNVTWEDAVAYAEWVGKRLPTLAEWFLAARGEFGHVRPYPGLEFQGNSTRPRDYGYTNESRLAAFTRWSCDYANGGGDSAEGVRELLGNVAEWVESPVVATSSAGMISNQNQRYVAGATWWASTPGAGTQVTTDRDLGSTGAWFAYGFRCARSEPP